MGLSDIVGLEVQDRVGVLSLADRPNRNAFTETMVHALLARLEEARQDSRIHCLLLVGLPEVFCAGASKDMLRSLTQGLVAPVDIQLPGAVLAFPVPVVAAMEGHAIGGGFALGLCADVVLVARESRYGASFMNMGFTPGMGMTQLMEHVMSPALARELLFSGEPRKGADFEGSAGFNYVLPRAQVRPRAIEVAMRIAEKPRGVLEVLKRALSLPRRQAYEASRTMESLMHELTFAGAARLIEENYD